MNDQTKYFVVRVVEKKTKREREKNCTVIIKSISMRNPFDEYHCSTNKVEARHRVTVGTPEDVFLKRKLQSMIQRSTGKDRFRLTNFLFSY